MPIIRPSTCAGTPLSNCSGTRPIRVGPVLAHQVVVAADAAAGHDHRLRPELELADGVSRRRHAARRAIDGSSTAPRTPVDRAVLDDELVDAMAMREGTFALTAQPPREDVDDRGPGPPGDVESRHRVAVPACVVAAALGPADQRESLQPALAQPAALLARGEVDVGVRPLPRPVVLGPVESRRAQPVLQRQLVAVADAQPALFGAVDEEQPAERPERLAADVGGVLLVDDQDRRPRSTSSHAATRPARPAPTTMTSASAMPSR